jgi:hypothetical protein
MTKEDRPNSGRHSDMKTDNYRRKDYFFPRSIRDAYGYDETFEPEIRCCSESLYQKQPNETYVSFMALYIAVISFSLFVWWIL